jgi:hypothetical protein
MIDITKDQFLATRDNSYKQFIPCDINSNLTIDQEFFVFTQLDRSLQFDGINWGFDDTEVRDRIMVEVINKFANMTVGEYYERNWFNTRVFVWDEGPVFKEMKRG